MIELRPVTVPTSEWDEIEEKIKELYLREVYWPLLSELNLEKNKLRNSRDDLMKAFQTGRLTFYRGKVSGKLTATLSKELRNLGAKWNQLEKCYSLPLQELPYEVQSAIRASSYLFEKKMQILDKKLSAVVPEQLAEKLKVSSLFDKTLFKVDKQFDRNVSKITIVPKLTDSQRQKIADDYQDNMKLWIRNFTEDEIRELRSNIQKSVFAGNRYGTLLDSIQKSYEVTAKKAKFLARQETHLFLAKFKEVRYADAGIYQYKWRCVTGTAMHPVRPRHRELNDMSQKGHIFRFDDPPITTEAGQPTRKNNPGQDYNCLLEDSVIKLGSGIRTVFRREYIGPLAILITQSGRKFVATPNHPVLTTRGWKPLGSLDPSDDLICVKQQVLDLIKDNVEDREATIGEIFASARESAPMETLKGSRRQFHGDGFDGEVNVIRTRGGLSVGVQSSFLQNFKEFFLASADRFRKVIGVSADDPTNLVQALSSFQELDRVKDLSFMEFSGHVYNLETASHWYIGEGNLVQMNCRCTAIPVVSFSEKRKSK